MVVVMKKLSILGLAVSILFLSWCMNTAQPEKDLSMNNFSTWVNSTWDWESSSLSWEKEVDTTWIVNETITEIEDIIWRSIPKNQDIWSYLSDYLSWQGLSWYIIDKKISRDNIVALSMKHKDYSGEHCADPDMISICINFVIQNETIIWSNAKAFIATSKQCEIDLKKTWSCANYPWDGLVYRFTNHGVLFKFWWGEWVPCASWGDDWFTYINIPSWKSFYSILSTIVKGISPDPLDELCNNKNTKRTTTETLKFFSSNYNRHDEREALPITAKTTEEAFFKYYKN